MRKILNEFYQRELAILIFLGDFLEHSIKREKISPIFYSFDPFPSLPSVATNGRKQLHCRQIAFNNKARPSFLEFN